MTLARFLRIVLAATCAGAAGCATAPADEPERTSGLPLAAAHSDITFMLSTGLRQPAACAEMPACATPRNAASVALTPFAAQVRRVADALQYAARDLYPDLAQRIPGLAYSGFDIHVVAGDEPGSVSSAIGLIALNAALGATQPYDDWLAFVIAREMGHVIALHHEENSSLSIAASVVMNILVPGSGLLKSAASTIGSELAVNSGRDRQARQADAIALKLLQVAGFSSRDVALSLAIAPAGLDDGSWSQEFRRSSESLIAGLRGAKLAGASALTAASGTP
ncbi:MAG: hypothetical protein HY017_09965 [Betaproteobacteria bacterium]|nr:hypothetical protein [Betaproteobacteria bacterium]